MKCRIIFFEGIPGIGKTTFANKCENRLSLRGKKVVHYPDDGSKNPLNFKGLKALTKKEYRRLSKEYSKDEIIKNDIKNANFGRYGKYIFLDSSKLNENLKEKVKDFNFYGGRLKSKDFLDSLKALYEEFVQNNKKSDEIFIFEGTLFRDVVDELYRFSYYDNTRLATEVSLLANILTPLSPTLFVLQTNFPERHLEQIKKLRTEDDKCPWADSLIDFVKNSMYGRICKVETFDDLELFLLREANLFELSFINSSWTKYMVNIDDYTLLNRKMEKFIDIIE